MYKDMLNYSRQELALMVTQFQSHKNVVTDVHERFVIYEAVHRYLNNHESLTMKWIEHSLQLSFPKVYSVVNNLVNKGYLMRKPSSEDKRIKLLLPTNKALDGVKLFEEMKLNELHALGISQNKIKGIPRLKEFSQATRLKIQEEFLSPKDWS
ncbi:hypothetical protein N8472_04585 [Gammaproteobacteria bacterium]|nr:hypothetical protein [Gammaproteobacteria bacterium]